MIKTILKTMYFALSLFFAFYLIDLLLKNSMYGFEKFAKIVTTLVFVVGTVLITLFHKHERKD